MEIILLEDIRNLGKTGEVVDVKDGYGRNFLLKLGKALRADKDNIDFVNKKKDEINKKNIELNSIDADLLNKGIAGEDGFGAIANPSSDNNSYRITSNEIDHNNIEMVTIKTILEDYPDDKFFPFIVKIDIEGGEENLFSMNTDWIKKIPMVIIELHDWLLPKQGTSTNFLKTVSELDRDFNIKGENIFSIKNRLN